MSRLRTRGSRESHRQGGLWAIPLRQVPPAEVVVLLHAACRHVGVGPAQNIREWAKRRQRFNPPVAAAGLRPAAAAAGACSALQLLLGTPWAGLQAAGQRCAGYPRGGLARLWGRPAASTPGLGSVGGKQHLPAVCSPGGWPQGALVRGPSLHWRAHLCGWVWLL